MPVKEKYFDPEEESKDYYFLKMEKTQKTTILPYKLDSNSMNDCILIYNQAEQVISKNDIQHNHKTGKFMIKSIDPKLSEIPGNLT